jgi:hypothetical protein
MSPAAITSAAPLPSFPTKADLISSTKTITTPSTPFSLSVSAPKSPLIPAWVQPDLSRLLRVEHTPGSFASRAVSLVSLPAGALFARITAPTPSVSAYSSVQATRDLHVELNSDLVYINHSCRPSLEFDMVRWEIRVVAGKADGLRAGEELTYFYPSTEWHMAQPFECRCGESVCRGQITGARDMSEKDLSNYWLNAHVEELLEERRASGYEKNSVRANGNGNRHVSGNGESA